MQVLEVHEQEKLIYIIEAATSKANVIKDLIRKVAELVGMLPGDAKKKKFVASCCVGRRYDIIAAVHTEMTQCFKAMGNKVFLVQCSAGSTQSSKQLPTFRVITQSLACQSEDLPNSCQVNSVRSHSWEGLRQRCLDPQCRHRARPGTEGTDSENEKEDAGELCEVNEDSDDDGAARSNLDLGGVTLDESRYVKNLWPFARPIAQSVRIFKELLHSEKATRVVLLSRSAHPGVMVAARELKLRVIGYFEVADHQYHHGQELLERMMIRSKWGEAKTILEKEGGKKRARGDELSFRMVAGPPMSDQLIEFKDIDAVEKSGWRGGVDRLVQLLPEKAASLLTEELETYHLSLVAAAEGKVLRAEKPFRLAAA